MEQIDGWQKEPFMIIKIPTTKFLTENWAGVAQDWILHNRDEGQLDAYGQKVFLTEGSFHEPSAPCRKRCCDNPYCLVSLKVKDWVSDEALDNPPTVSVYKGIKNLGATCYLNSLLQIWFFNVEFRRGIYAYVPTHQTSQNIITQLRDIFSQLQHSKARFIDVKGLVTGLNLNQAVQQDALEFSKLLMSLIETVLESDAKSLTTKPSSKTLAILSQYKGVQVYSTTCLTCKSVVQRPASFYELEVSIVEDVGLVSALKDMMKSEALEGDNKYMCSTCNSKQNAKRQLKITEWPRCLNIHVNRFVFDMKTMTKKKVSAPLLFPKWMDMGPLGGSNIIYDLKAVLLHQGLSANSGHYIARVYDEEKEIWISCDDEEVIQLKDAQFELGTSQQSTVILGKKEFSSKTAYGLMYVKRGDVVQKYDPVPESILVASEGQNAKDELESNILQKLDDERKELDKVRKQEYEHLFSIWSTRPFDTEVSYLSSKSLKEVLKLGTADLVQQEEDLSFQNVEKGLLVTSNDLLCSHSKISPDMINKFKRISSVGMEKLESLGFNFEPRLTSNDFCDVCFREILVNRADTIAHSNNLEILDKKSKGMKYYISKAWLTEYRKKVPFDGKVVSPSEYEHDVYCKHKKLVLESEKKASLISKAFLMLLKKMFTTFTTLDKNAIECQDCLVAELGNDVNEPERILLQDEQKVLKRIFGGRALVLEEETLYFIIPTVFVNQWRTYLKSMKIADKVSSMDCSVLFCEHKMGLDDRFVNGKAGDHLGTVITDIEWTVFSDRYLIQGAPMTLVGTEICRNVVFTYKPHVCIECRDKKRQEYEFAKITIVKRQAKSESSGGRSSKRSRGSLSAAKRVAVEVNITPSTSVRDLMVNLITKFHVPPLYQKLYRNEIELTDGDLKMEELGIFPGEELEIELFEQDDKAFEGIEVLMVDDTDHMDIEVGFAGTGLYFGANEMWNCKTCTLVNNQTDLVCVACEQPKAT